MAMVEGGHPNFGQILGIIMADTVRPRVPGDPGNASTYPFPVRYLTVSGSTWARFVEGQAEGLLEPFMIAAQELERQGVKAITTSCGLLTSFQEALADSVRIPTFASCLLQVPLLLRMLNRELKVCVITLVSSCSRCANLLVGSISERHSRRSSVCRSFRSSVPCQQEMTVKHLIDRTRDCHCWRRHSVGLERRWYRGRSPGVLVGCFRDKLHRKERM